MLWVSTVDNAHSDRGDMALAAVLLRSAPAKTMMRTLLLTRSVTGSSSAGGHRDHGSDDVDFGWAPSTAADAQQWPVEAAFRAGLRHHHICNTAFPIGHNTTVRAYRVPRTRDQADMHRVLRGAFGGRSELMLYAHVPFCHQRCQFCEYTVVDPRVGTAADAQTAYLDALAAEFALYDAVLDTRSKRVVGFDIGGGTPSLPPASAIERIMASAQRHFSFDPSACEVSIETTPRIAAAEPDKLRAYYSMGIRRISMGVQTTDFRQARELGRDDANGDDYIRRAVENVRAAGFRSFNVDLMYGFPQRAGGRDPWEETVRDAIALGTEHITLYRMRYKGTRMAHLVDRVALEQVNAQEATARRLLTEHGFDGLPGKNTYSRVAGNSGCSSYLDRRVREGMPYLGYGLGAQSFSPQTLSYNLGAVTKHMYQYITSVSLGRIPIQDLYHMSLPAAVAKMVSVSFYYGGIDLASFERCFRVPLTSMFPREVDFVQQLGLMQFVTTADGLQRLQMTPKGKAHFGGVVALFYSPSVKEYIMSLPGGETFAEDPIVALLAGRGEKGPVARPTPAPAATGPIRAPLKRTMSSGAF